MQRGLITWYFLTVLQVFAFATAAYFDLHINLWNEDQTKLSFAILGLWVVSTVFIGIWHTKKNKIEILHVGKIGWYLAETALALGMLGTLAGFLLMLGTAFTNIDVNDTATLQTALTNMALGMSTALYTTLVGLIVSIFLKSQLVNLEHYADGLRRQV
jgi:hypothetical protein